MGVTHIRAYQKIRHARIVAVCDAQRLPEKGILRGVAGNIKKSDDIDLGPQVRAFNDLDELLAMPGIDIVDICTPTPLHSAQVVAALKAGKHVLCEKPLARTSAEAKKVLQAASAAKTFLMPAMCMRFWTGWREVKQLVSENKYGRVLAAHFRRVSQMPAWSAAQTYTKSNLGGALFDLHIHDTDFIQHLFGVPRSVFSSGVVAPSGSINHVVTHYQYPGGPVVSAEGSWLHTGGFNMSFSVNFERATLEYDFAAGAQWRLSEPGKKTRVIAPRGPDGYDGEIRYFVDCVARGQSPRDVTPADALAVLRICEAEEKSVRTGKAVSVVK